MHGGTAQATSEGLGKGSQFSIRLPVWKPVQPSIQEPASSEGNPAQDGVEASKARSAPLGRKVLVVDDNVTWAESLALLLSLEGHESDVVHDGPTALQSLRKYTYDVVFMDIGLPHMDGYEVARRLRQEPGLGQPMLVAITGYAEDDARRRSHEAGYDHHLVKPVDPEAILALLASMEWADATEPARPERARAATEV
jgi:CheY-like chemotaxis protein